MAATRWRLPFFPTALAITVTLGLLLGWASPRPAHASNFWEFWHDIAVGGTTGQTVYLNCGWHTECVSPWTKGNALDWEETNSYAYLAGAAKWDSWYVTNAAYADVSYEEEYNGSKCKNVVAEIRNWYTGALLAREVYEHVERSGSTTIQIHAYSSPWPIRRIVGDVSTDELDNCTSWTGSHVHQYGLGFTATDDGPNDWDPFPNAASCNDDACWSTSNQTWMHYEAWTY